MNRTIGIVLGLAFIGLLVFFLFSNQKVEYNWNENYSQEGMQPYDLDLLYELLDDLEGSDLRVDMESRIPQALPVDADLEKERPSYVFVGWYPYYSSAEADSLLLFVERGGTALISSQAVPKDLMDYLYFDNCYHTDNGALAYWQNYHVGQDSSVAVNLAHPQLRLQQAAKVTFRDRDGADVINWSFIPEDYLCDENRYPWAALGSFRFETEAAEQFNPSFQRHTVPSETVKKDKDYLNFIRIGYGKGHLYLHSTPRLFSNYFLREKAVLNYANRVFSHLPKGRIYWDKVSEYPVRAERSETRRPRRVAESPLQYILAQPALRWAWYLLIAGALLFVLFRAKRRQRIIPVVEENRNTSLAFVTTIGSLYFQRSNHKHLVEQQMQLFLNRMRQRYGIALREREERDLQRLAERSEVPRPQIDELFTLYTKVEAAAEIKESTLIRFYNLLENFYQQAK